MTDLTPQERVLCHEITKSGISIDDLWRLPNIRESFSRRSDLLIALQSLLRRNKIVLDSGRWYPA